MLIFRSAQPGPCAVATPLPTTETLTSSWMWLTWQDSPGASCWKGWGGRSLGTPCRGAGPSADRAAQRHKRR